MKTGENWTASGYRTLLMIRCEMDENEVITVDVSRLYEATGTAKLAALPEYETAVLQPFPCGARQGPPLERRITGI